MKLLLDTNIVLDILLSRTDFFDDSFGVMQKAITNGDKIYLSASAVTDVYYIFKKQKKSKEQALNAIKRLSKLINFAEVTEECVIAASFSKMNDFEDAVVDAVASHIKASYIITRNEADYKYSKNKVLTPKEFLNK